MGEKSRFVPVFYMERKARLFPAVCLSCGKYMDNGEKYVTFLCKDFQVTSLCWECWEVEREAYKDVKPLQL